MVQFLATKGILHHVSYATVHKDAILPVFHTENTVSRYLYNGMFYTWQEYVYTETLHGVAGHVRMTRLSGNVVIGQGWSGFRLCQEANRQAFFFKAKHVIYN